jgi:hypothetical protein
MKFLPFVLVCLFGASFICAQSAKAQDDKQDQNSAAAVTAETQQESSQTSGITLVHRPGDSIVAEAEKPDVSEFHPTRLIGGETIPEGMVWVPAGKEWSAREINSCQWCSQPMTFRQAALDKKTLGMWGAALALTVADIEILVSRPCVANKSCHEGNPFLGQTRAQQYSIRLPVIALGWASTAWLRKGDRRLKVGGMKRWWLMPVLYQAAAGAGVIANLAR